MVALGLEIHCQGQKVDWDRHTTSPNEATTPLGQIKASVLSRREEVVSRGDVLYVSSLRREFDQYRVKGQRYKQPIPLM